MNDPILETYKRANITFVKGRGPWLETSDGDHYLDMGSGIAVNSLGHANEDLIKALTNQASKLWHTSNLYNIPNQTQLAQKLVENTFAEKVFFTNSGTESIECALKMARKYHFDRGNYNKNKTLSFEGSFHGRSIASISASGSEKLTHGFGPLLAGFKSIPFEDYESLTNISFDRVGAILIEPIQGEGGIRQASYKFLRRLREICDKNGILLIFDEVQSGVGRTGLLFAHEYSKVEPDILAIAKGIGGGFPLGCCLCSSEVANAMTVGTHGSTFGGNPLACSVGLAVLDKILSTEFLTSVSEKGVFLKERLGNMVSMYPSVFESVRGVGLMLGLKCNIDNTKLIDRAYLNRLLVIPAGDNVIRILPPLNVTYEELKEALKRLQKSANDLVG